MPFTAEKNEQPSQTGVNGHTTIEVNNHEDKCGTCGDVDCNIQVNPKKKQKMNTKMIQCDKCTNWFHGLCQGMQITDLNLIAKLKKNGVRWHCDQSIENNSPAELLEQNAPLTQHKATMSKLNNIEQALKGMHLSYADALN